MPIHLPVRLKLVGWFVVLVVAGGGASVAHGEHTGYSSRIVNSTAGGNPGYFYVGGPLNVTLREGRGREKGYELCMTPAPIDRPACRRARTGRTVDGLAPSRAGRTKVRFEVSGGPVLVRYIRVRRP